MYQPLRQALQDVRAFCQLDAQKRVQYLDDPERDFTRRRLLPFDRTVGLVLSLLKKVSRLN